MFDSVLVANRGEIAVRVLRTLRRLGVRGIAVYSDADARAPHVALADAAVLLGPAPAAESYLAVDRLLDAADRTGAQAVHPGYGFLSESAAFARACAAAGLVFVGPPAGAIEAMGDKIRAKRIAEDAGVPVLPGVAEPGLADDALVARSAGVGFPLLVKAAAGGGGKGMRVVREPADLPGALAAARREARAAFGADSLLLERYVERPRHVEIQVLADTQGSCVWVGERECSLQRRYQKVIEEAPSPRLDPAVRERMGASAVDLAKAVGYAGAGTVEYIVAGDEVAFLEMNTRLQVEHPVTEEVFGLDLVEHQLRIAAGEPLAVDQADLVPRGHAIEARVYAEDPDRGFLPTGGTVLALRLPEGAAHDAGVAARGRARLRLDLGIAAGMRIGSDYDPMLGKVIASGADRAEALRHLDDGLRDLAVLGLTTNVAFLRRLLADARVRSGDLDTGLVGRLLERQGAPEVPAEAFAVAALADLAAGEPAPGTPVDPFDVPGGWRVGEHAPGVWRFADPAGRAAGNPAGAVEVRVWGRAADARVSVAGEPPQPAALRAEGPGRFALGTGTQTRHWTLAVDGDVTWVGRDGAAWPVRHLAPQPSPRGSAAATRAGPLRAPLPGTVTIVEVAEGDRVKAGQTLLVVEAMKMEHPVTAPFDGTVTLVAVRPGQQVPIDAQLVVVEPDAAGEGGP